jgi:hypothetical protein
VNNDLLINYLKQRAKATLADSCINDFFNSLNEILDNSISYSNGNFSILEKMLQEEIEKFMNKVSKIESFLKECGLLIRFENSIKFYNYTEGYLIELDAKVYVKDVEGLFLIERSNKIKRFLIKDKIDHEVFPNNSS